MSYQGTVEYLYALQKFGMKFGLDNIRKLLGALGNPQNSFRSVHIAGTNGKGSTSAVIDAVLRSSGTKTGLFTSPHLINFTERIRINGSEISEGDVVALAGEVRETADRIGGDFSPTFFEVVTAMAFLHFRRTGIKWAIVETGLGGRLDATNVLMPEATVLTSIGFDHREFLGRTLKEIASEKAGIIKPAVPLVCAQQDPEAMGVIRQRALEKGSDVFSYGRDFKAELVLETPTGICFDYHGMVERTRLTLPLIGAHQMINASLGIRTVEILSESSNDLFCDTRAGLENVVWPGRLEMIKEEPPIMIDGAHNPQAAGVLAYHIGNNLLRTYNRIVMVIGIMADKDVRGILEHLLPLGSEVVFTSAAYGRAATTDFLCREAASMGYSSLSSRSVSDALSVAEEIRRPGDLIIVTGSFYTIGEAREVLCGSGVLTRLRE